MMNLSKISEYFNPLADKSRIHIIGCGSVGSSIAELLVRDGLTNITLYDFDIVEPKNLANQMFRQADVGRPKVEALADMLYEINDDLRSTIKLKPNGWKGDRLAGYVFLCVDSIETRREIVESNMANGYIKAMFDFRTRLEDAQHYAADWSKLDSRKELLNSMNFSHEEAEEETPVSACGTTLGVASTVRVVTALGVSNFMNFFKGHPLKKLIVVDAFKPDLLAF